MKKHLLNIAVASLALGLLATPAFATQSRINSMGGGVKQITVLDERNIFALPAELVKWGTWAGLEIDGPGHTSFGFHYNFNPTTVLALYGTNQQKNALDLDGSNGLPSVLQATDGFANTGDAGSTHKMTAIFGVDLGTTRLGFLVGFWGDNRASFDDGDVDTARHGPLKIEAGIGAGFAMGAADLDLGLSFQYGSTTDLGNDAEVLSNNSQIDIGLLGRLTVPFSGPHEIVAFLGFDVAISNGQFTQDGSNAMSGFAWNLVLGSDIRLNLADGIIVQPGIGFRFGQAAVTTTPDDGDIVENKAGQFVAPFYNVAVDVKVTDWLDIRFGGGQEVVFNSTSQFTDAKLDAGGTSNSDVRHKIATGVGFNLPAGVGIDIEVSTGWWKQGPYFISGNQGNFGMNAAIYKDW